MTVYGRTAFDWAAVAINPSLDLTGLIGKSKRIDPIL